MFFRQLIDARARADPFHFPDPSRVVTEMAPNRGVLECLVVWVVLSGGPMTESLWLNSREPAVGAFARVFL